MAIEQAQEKLHDLVKDDLVSRLLPTDFMQCVTLLTPSR